MRTFTDEQILAKVGQSAEPVDYVQVLNLSLHLTGNPQSYAKTLLKSMVEGGLEDKPAAQAMVCREARIPLPGVRKTVKMAAIAGRIGPKGRVA
jgi:hypothetical protein